MSKYYTQKPLAYPTEERVAEKRAEKHKNHIDYFYGSYWNIFIKEDGRCFLEFDIGHFATEFIIREIPKKDYDALKADTSLFEKISNSVR